MNEVKWLKWVIAVEPGRVFVWLADVFGWILCFFVPILSTHAWICHLSICFVFVLTSQSRTTIAWLYSSFCPAAVCMSCFCWCMFGSDGNLMSDVSVIHWTMIWTETIVWDVLYGITCSLGPGMGGSVFSSLSSALMHKLLSSFFFLQCWHYVL